MTGIPVFGCRRWGSGASRLLVVTGWAAPPCGRQRHVSKVVTEKDYVHPEGGATPAVRWCVLVHFPSQFVLGWEESAQFWSGGLHRGLMGDVCGPALKSSPSSPLKAPPCDTSTTIRGENKTKRKSQMLVFRNDLNLKWEKPCTKLTLFSKQKLMLTFESKLLVSWIQPCSVSTD